jgi:hypothetical protein
MKQITLILSLFFVSNLIADETLNLSKPEKTIELKNHINKMTLQGNNTYRLELRESAAAYYAPEKLAPCLQKSIKENKKATLKVAVYSLTVLDCKI